MAIAASGDIVYSDLTVARGERSTRRRGRSSRFAGMAPNVIGVPAIRSGAVFTSGSGDLEFLPSVT
jgi:hypothetical protein